MGDLQEGRNAHFEAQLHPVSDPTMKVEWYMNGKPITASMFSYTILYQLKTVTQLYNYLRFKNNNNI